MSSFLSNVVTIRITLTENAIITPVPSWEALKSIITILQFHYVDDKSKGIVLLEHQQGFSICPRPEPGSDAIEKTGGILEHRSGAVLIRHHRNRYRTSHENTHVMK
ncbi:hypothetical protein NQ317_008581 [Molorchus minor]|uniref:Uncharacterized protein n=1 Tax=Molorchus minor TaxID=1323400 RepID=A0ABQ9J301_9CUCU|nr:hypothetical protein NQ317_008581 [Molorchus minor]